LAETLSASVDQPAADDLISFLKAIPVGEAFSVANGFSKRRGWQIPPWGALPAVVPATGGGAGDAAGADATASHGEAVQMLPGFPGEGRLADLHQSVLD
jgi:hypothetical protein